MPRAFHDNLAMEASLSNRYSTQQYGDSSTDKMDQVQLINRWSWYTAGWLTLSSGFDYCFDYVNSTDTGLETRNSGGVYTTAEFTVRQKFQVIPSIKVVTDSNTVVPVPKLGLLWKPLDGLAVKNNYYRSFKFPIFEDLYWPSDGTFSGNPNLKPEDGVGGDLGVSWETSGKRVQSLRAESTFFAQYTVDSIHWASAGGRWSPSNIAGGAWMFGLDNAVGATIPFTWLVFTGLDVSASYQYLQTYLLSYGYDWADKKRVPYSPAHTVGGSLGLRWASGLFAVSGHFEGLRYTNTANTSELDPFFLLNFNVNQNIGKNFVVFANLRNALNAAYETSENYPMPGTSFTIGLRFSYANAGENGSNGAAP
jgi:vitamin B12 transporter